MEVSQETKIQIYLHGRLHITNPINNALLNCNLRQTNKGAKQTVHNTNQRWNKSSSLDSGRGRPWQQCWEGSNTQNRELHIADTNITDRELNNKNQPYNDQSQGNDKHHQPILFINKQTTTVRYMLRNKWKTTADNKAKAKLKLLPSMLSTSHFLML